MFRTAFFKRTEIENLHCTVFQTARRLLIRQRVRRHRRLDTPRPAQTQE